jgi:HEAT repeat protein
VQAVSDERPDVLLQSALEKIVYFEARAEQLHHELASTRGEVEHLKRELAAAEERELGLRREVAELEVRVGRLSAEREELGRLNQALRTERTQLLDKLLEASRIRTAGRREEEEEEGLGIDLASFISQLRSEALGRPVQALATLAGPGASPAAEPPRPREVEVAAPALAVAVAAAPAAAASVVQHAVRLHQEGRLAVSAGQLAELAGEGDETLFGFSVRELAAPDATSRVRAAERLKALGRPAAAPALASALHAEKEPAVQVALLQAFAEVGGAEGASVVSPLLASPVPEVRIASLKALLALAPQEAAPHLAQAVKDPDRAVRRRASLLALGLQGESARRLGEQAIQDADAEVRGLAALALGACSGESARTLLLEALKDSEERVRRAAAQSLSRILGQDVSAVVSMDEGRRRREIRRLSALPVQPVRASLTPPAAAPARSARPSAPSAPAPAPRPGPSLVEALCGKLLEEIRVTIRGRSLGELASGLAVTPEVTEEALALLVARGAVVRRGHKYFAA